MTEMLIVFEEASFGEVSLEISVEIILLYCSHWRGRDHVLLGFELEVPRK